MTDKNHVREISNKTLLNSDLAQIKQPIQSTMRKARSTNKNLTYIKLDKSQTGDKLQKEALRINRNSIDQIDNIINI